MATGRNAGLDYPAKAAGDLSAAQYHGVYHSANDTVNLPADGVQPCSGVLQDKPAAAGRGAVVRFLGQSKVKAGGTLAINDRITMAASGYFVACTSGGAPCGVCIKSATSGYIGEAIMGIGACMSVSSAQTGQG